MFNRIEIGPTPLDEDCAQVGEHDYGVKAPRECQRFIKQLRECFGPEPEGAELRMIGSPHDFGTYYEVYCVYDPKKPDSLNYALNVENKTPATWKDRFKRQVVNMLGEDDE